MPQKAHVQKGDDPSFGQFVDFYKFLQIGRIVRVDNERNVVDIQFGSNPVLSQNIPITNPFFTGRAFIGGMPEEGTMVVCGFVKFTNKVGTPIIINYIDPEYFKALSYIYNSGKTSSDVLALNDIHDKIGYNVKRLKKRKQYPGDVGLESTYGAEVCLDENILLSDSRLNEILLSSADRTIYTNSVNNHQYTNAARILNGTIIRPNSPVIAPVRLDNGQLFYVATDGPTVDENGRAFTEVRTEVREVANAVLDIIEKYDVSDFADNTSTGRLLISQVLGTLVGNQKSDMERYGRVLRPQIFTANGAVVDDIICKPSEYFNLASAYQLKVAGFKFDIDKEGHTFVNLGASSAVHPLGAGRSLEFAADGSIRMAIGKTNVGEKSIELDTKGKVVVHFGYDSETLRSAEWTLDRGIRTIVNGPDIDGYASYSDYAGNSYERVRGDKTLDVDGSYIVTVKGKIQENILGAKVENYINDKMTNYGGDYQEIVVNKKQSKIGAGSKTDIATGGDTLNILQGDKIENLTLGSKKVTIVAGDSTETLTFGNKETTLTAGNIKDTILKGNNESSILLGDHKIDVTTGNISENVKLGNSTETIGSGNKSITIKIGNFDVSITAGNISIKTTTGTVNMSSATQTVTINGMLAVNVNSQAKVNINAPLVSIGNLALGSVLTGLPGVPSCLDPITGLPFLGSKTVNAAL